MSDTNLPRKYQRRLVAELAAILSYAHDQDIAPMLWDTMNTQDEEDQSRRGVRITTTSLQLYLDDQPQTCNIVVGTPPVYAREISSMADAVAEKLYAMVTQYREVHGESIGHFDQYELFRVCELGMTRGQGVMITFDVDGGVSIKAVGVEDSPTLSYTNAKKEVVV